MLSDDDRRKRRRRRAGRRWGVRRGVGKKEKRMKCSYIFLKVLVCARNAACIFQIIL